MKSHEFITELMTSKVPYQVTQAKTYHFQAVANIGSRQIIYNAGYDRDEDTWTIEFVERGGPKARDTVAKTGSGNELQVFSFVIEATKELVARYKPARIEFTSAKSDENRSSLYKRLIKRFPVPGYQEIGVTSSPDTDYFTIVRVDQ